MHTRDEALFPHNQTGEKLWQWLNLGVDLNQHHEVEFSVIFQEESQALAYAQILLENNQKLSFTPYPEHATHPWEVTAYPSMPLSYHNITGYQALLTSHLNDNALFDGWFCPNLAALTEHID